MFDPKQMLLDAGTVLAVEKLLKSAYKQGRDDERKAILAAVSAADDGVIVGDKVEAEVVRRPPPPTQAGKAPRGTVPKVLGRMLTEYPGLTIVGYESLVGQFDNRIAVKSIGNELRRMENKRYRRDDDGRWFLVKRDEEAGDGHETNSPASDHTNQGSTLWNRPD